MLENTPLRQRDNRAEYDGGWHQRHQTVQESAEGK
jgi:hypothetical protein